MPHEETTVAEALIASTGRYLLLAALPERCDEVGMAGHLVRRFLGNRADLVVADPAGLPSADDHADGWLRSAGFFEQVRKLDWSKPDWRGVIYLDAFATCVDRVVPKELRRTFIAGRHRLRCAEAEGDYWKTMADWFDKGRLPRIEATTVIEDLAGSLAGAARPEEEERLFVVDDLDGACSPDHLLRIVEGMAPGLAGAVLSPKAHELLAHPKLGTKQRLFLLDHHDLAPAVYASLLQRCAVYLAPAGAAFGTASLALLPATCEKTIGRMRPVADPPPSAPKPAPEPAGSGQAPADLATWFQQLPTRKAPMLEPVVARESIDSPRPIAAPASPGIPDLALVLCCHRYLQRFRCFIDSVVRQDHPLERLEVAIASPGDVDGLHEYVNLLRLTHPKLRLQVVDVPPDFLRNKGKMLNAAYAKTTAERIMVCDCDLILPRAFIRTVLGRHQPRTVLGCWRTPVGRLRTAQILVGNLDAVARFDDLHLDWDREEEQTGVRQGLLGYCQVVTRDAFEAAGRYPEDFDGFQQSDIVFVDRLRERAGVASLFCKDLYVLHLSHARDWTGAKSFL